MSNLLQRVRDFLSENGFTLQEKGVYQNHQTSFEKWHCREHILSINFRTDEEFGVFGGPFKCLERRRCECGDSFVFFNNGNKISEAEFFDTLKSFCKFGVLYSTQKCIYKTMWFHATATHSEIVESIERSSQEKVNQIFYEISGKGKITLRN